MSTSIETPNVLLIIADDLGRDTTSISGTGTARKIEVHTNDGAVDIYGEMPTVSLLLRSGLCFDQAWAQPACSPTRASIYTGLHPWKSGVGSPMSMPELDSSAGFTTLPSLLPSGYVSALFGKWHLGNRATTWPTDHGWDRHVGTLGGVLPSEPRGYEDWDIVDSATGYEAEATESYATRRTVAEAAAWINAHRPRRPWFATVAFHTPHDPFHIPPDGFDPATPGDPASEDHMFNVMVQNMDFNIGSLLGTRPAPPSPLGGLGLPGMFDPIRRDQLANTIVVFIGDNGSYRDIAFEESKTEIGEGGLRVPMIIADGQALVNELESEDVAPRFLHASRLNGSYRPMVHVVDLYKTIARLVDPETTGFPIDSDSRDLSTVLTSAPASGPVIPGSRPDVNDPPGTGIDSPPVGFPNVELPHVVRVFNFSQWYADDGTRATIRNARYKLNYDSTLPDYQLFLYVDAEIPGREDDGTAVDLYPDAVSGLNEDALDNLNLLLDELIANYQRDETCAFRDPRPF